MIQAMLRTLILYALLVGAMRITGKRQIGQLQLSELVTTLLVSEIAVAPISDTRIPLSHAIAPILLVVGLELVISFLVTKSRTVKSIFEGKPSFIIREGKIDQKELLRQRISIDELLSALRQSGMSTPGEVSFAIMEGNGQVSVFSKEDLDSFAYPLIIDGKIDQNACDAAGVDQDRLASLLTGRRCEAKDAFLLTVSKDGTVFLAPKDK